MDFTKYEDKEFINQLLKICNINTNEQKNNKNVRKKVLEKILFKEKI